MSQLLQQKISSARRRNAAVALVTGFCSSVAALLLALGISAALDWSIGLSLRARATLVAVNIAILLYVLTRHAILPIVRAPDDEDIALQVERQQPSFSTRLIACIQLTRPGAILAGASPALVQALVQETETLSRPINFARVVKTDRLRKQATFAGVLIAAWAALFLAAPRATSALLQRALLVPGVDRPHKTSINSLTRDTVVARGDSLTLTAEAAGVIPSAGRVVIQYSTGTPREFPLDRLESSNHFQRPLANLQESFTYTLFLNDNQAGPYRVNVVERPAIASIRCRQTFPSYTGFAPVDRQPTDLSLLLGSTLHISVQANKNLASGNSGNRIRLTGSNAPIPLLVDPHDRTRATSTAIPIADAHTAGFRIDLVDDLGIASQDSPLYPIDVIADRAPTVKVTSSQPKEQLITTAATLVIGFEAADDIALAKVSLVYTLQPTDDSTTRNPPRSIPLGLPKNLKSFRGQYRWTPAKTSAALPIGSTVEWWLEAEDANSVTGPGRAESEHFTARVVTDEAKRADLLARMGERFKQINEVNQSQEELNADLGKIVQEKSPPK
jgi:hypothetical protein